LLSKFHRRTNITVLLFSNSGPNVKLIEWLLIILKFDILRLPPIQIMAKIKPRIKPWVLLSKFHRKTNLMALLLCNMGPGIKLLLKILKFDIPRVPPIQISTKKGWTLSFVHQSASRAHATYNKLYAISCMRYVACMKIALKT
jgi:hypothetical protein